MNNTQTKGDVKLFVLTLLRRGGGEKFKKLCEMHGINSIVYGFDEKSIEYENEEDVKTFNNNFAGLDDEDKGYFISNVNVLKQVVISPVEHSRVYDDEFKGSYLISKTAAIKCLDIFEKSPKISVMFNEWIKQTCETGVEMGLLDDCWSRPSPYEKITLGFHSNQLCERGTSIALFDYAYFNQRLLNNKSIVFYRKTNVWNDANVVKKFEGEFDCIGYDNFIDINKVIVERKIDYLYNIKPGDSDGQLVTSCPNLIHGVFKCEPHGEKFALVSQWLANKHQNKVDFIPHMINLPTTQLTINEEGDLREILKIPANAFVFGRHGGYDSFNIEIAHTAIINFLNRGERPESPVYFLFVNTKPFYFHPRIIYLNRIVGLKEKIKFIKTCDAMIHARKEGETFGLAVAEFSLLNKPVVTSKSAVDNAHIEMLGDRAIIFDSEKNLIEIFTNIKQITSQRNDWNAYKEYTPKKVMEKFKTVFQI